MNSTRILENSEESIRILLKFKYLYDYSMVKW